MEVAERIAAPQRSSTRTIYKSNWALFGTEKIHSLCETSLTLRTTFLLALASGKCRSKIHAWVANKVSNLGLWEKVALFLSSDFIAKHQLAREGSQSVSPVTIPALITIVDKQFKEDRTLCPVLALRYYLD